MTHLEPLMNEPGVADNPSVKLTLAEALVKKKSSTDADRARAIELVKEINGKVPAGELSRVAALIDPKLVDELGLPDPGGADAPPRRRGRGRGR
jgi:hypothetical protein